MPGSYLIDVKSGIVYTRGWGILTDGQIAEHARALRADPLFDPGFRQIVDLRDLTDARITGRGIRDVAAINPFRRDARRAFVVVSDETFGLTRMFGFFSESSSEQFGIFRTIEPALEWIGLDPKAAWPKGKPDATFGVP